MPRASQRKAGSGLEALQRAITGALMKPLNANESMKPAKLARTPPHRLKLSLQPYVALLELSHPVDELMRRLKHSEFSAVSNAVSSADKRHHRTASVRRSRKPIFLAVHRVNHSVYFK